MTTSPSKGSLLVVFLTVFVDLLGFGMVLPLLPIYADQFTVDEGGWQLGLLMASFSAMQFLFAPLWGRLSDHIGRRPVLMIGLAGSVVFYLLFAAATIWRSLPWLFVSRVGAGVAGATISTAQAYIADCTSKHDRSKGMALIGMAFGMGFTFGPLLGFLAAPTAESDPGPWPGYAAAILSALAFALAVFWLPESLRSDSKPAGGRTMRLSAWRDAISVPSVGTLLTTLFVCVFCLVMFESTLGLLLKGQRGHADAPFNFSYRDMFLAFAYVGFTLALVQGVIVRRLAGRVSDGALAASGAFIEVAGLAAVALATQMGSAVALFVALTVLVAGFALLHPSLNALLSRRSDPAKQGTILGVGQSVNSLARILGSLVGIPLMRVHIAFPYHAAAALMAVGWILVLFVIRRGSDYPVEATTTTETAS